MQTSRTRSILTYMALGTGALAVLVTGADHLDEYIVNQFSSVPTIGTLFLLNFIAATIVGLALLAPWQRFTPRLAEPLRLILGMSGIGITASSLIGLWISEQSSLFGFSDHGYRPAIVVAIIAEAVAVVALTSYLGLVSPHLRRQPAGLPS